MTLKYVKAANMWVVTKSWTDKGKQKFEQHWFMTREEAEKFIEENK